MRGHGMGMRAMMILMDTDGDGALSLEEVQTAHAKFFKAIEPIRTEKSRWRRCRCSSVVAIRLPITIAAVRISYWDASRAVGNTLSHRGLL